MKNDDENEKWLRNERSPVCINEAALSLECYHSLSVAAPVAAPRFNIRISTLIEMIARFSIVYHSKPPFKTRLIGHQKLAFCSMISSIPIIFHSFDPLSIIDGNHSEISLISANFHSESKQIVKSPCFGFSLRLSNDQTAVFTAHLTSRRLGPDVNILKTRLQRRLLLKLWANVHSTSRGSLWNPASSCSCSNTQGCRAAMRYNETLAEFVSRLIKSRLVKISETSRLVRRCLVDNRMSRLSFLHRLSLIQWTFQNTVVFWICPLFRVFLMRKFLWYSQLSV